MKIAEYNGFEFHIPTSGGKAGRGHNRTSTLQIRRDGCIKKQFRFVVADLSSRLAAYEKARRYTYNGH